MDEKFFLETVLPNTSIGEDLLSDSELKDLKKALSKVFSQTTHNTCSPEKWEKLTGEKPIIDQDGEIIGWKPPEDNSNE